MKVRMHEKCMNMWHANLKNIMGSGQSKPISTHHCSKVITHLKCMKHCYNADVMQCMMISNNLNKPIPKISQKLQNFWKPPKFIKKPQKLGQKYEMHEKVKQRISY